MIENFYYSIPKWKKITYVALIVLFLFSLVSVKTQSGLFAWAAQEITDNITNEIFESVNQAISGGVGTVLDVLSNVFTDPWGPQLTTFGNNTNYGGANVVKMLENFGIWIGVFIATIIYFFSMFTYFFSGKITDSKDTPISLTARYAVAMAICYKLETVINTFLDIVDKINEGYVRHALNSTMADASGGFLVLLGEAIDGWFKARIGEAVLTAMIPGVHIIIIIVQLFLIWKVLKGLFKLYAEMVSRYILSCFSVLLFAGFAGTIVSNNTSQIFKSYIQSLFGTFFVLLFNILWFKVCILTIMGVINNRSMLQYFFLLELMAFGLKLDGYLRSMGLNVAASGSRIASACGGAGRSLMMGLRMAGDMRRGGGNMLKEAGAAMAAKGDPNGAKLFSLGSKIGAGTSTGDILKGRANPNNGMLNLASSLGANGMKMNDNIVSGAQAADIMSRAMSNPADKDAQNAMRALSNNKLAEGAQAMMGDKYKVDNAALVSQRGADGMEHTGVKFNATPVNPDGSEGKAFTGTLSATDSFADASGETFGADDAFSMQKDDISNSMNRGESVAVDDFEDFGGSVAAEALESANGINFDYGQVESMGRNADGENSFRCFDSAGTLSGTIQGDEFIASSSRPDADGNVASADMLENARTGITAMGYSDCTDFTPVEGKEGVYKATATDENGNTKVFTATDRGIYTDSKINDDVASFRVDGTDSYGNNTSMNVNASNISEGSMNTNGSEASGQSFGRGNTDSSSNGFTDSGNSRGDSSSRSSSYSDSSSISNSSTSVTTNLSNNSTSTSTSRSFGDRYDMDYMSFDDIGKRGNEQSENEEVPAIAKTKKSTSNPKRKSGSIGGRGRK